MKNPLLRIAKNFAVLWLALFIFGGQPAGQEKTFFHGFLIPNPVIKIGLGINLGDIKVSASSGMKIYEVMGNYKLIADDVDNVFIRGHKEKLNEKYVIQVAQSHNQEKAERIAEDLRRQFDHKVYVERDAEERIAGIYQVKIGDFITRGEALTFIKQLNAAGISEAWILREDMTEESKPVWILVNDELKTLNKNTVLYCIPSSAQSYLSFNGRDYRGIFILKSSAKGVVLINLLNMEDYLKSVVPSELSPYDFPELEAQKAQAVAARTYAIKNLGQYEDLGFDLVDTPKSQFYQGMNAEHPLSTEAVEQTKGEGALYKGKLIDALYTSTCGGSTENVEDVFRGPALPYLRSTTCVYEDKEEWEIKSRVGFLPVYINEENISPEIALLQSLGIIGSQNDPLYYSNAASAEELKTWIAAVRSLQNRPGSPALEWPEKLTLMSFADIFVKDFGWDDRVTNLMLESEKNYILDGIQTSNSNGDALAFLIQSRFLPPLDSLGNFDRPPSRGEAVVMLAMTLAEEGVIHRGVFKSLSDGKLQLVENDEPRDIPYSREILVIKNHSGRYHFGTHAHLLGGESVRWVEKDDKAVLLEVIYDLQSNILDRSSAFHKWSLKRSRAWLQNRLNNYYPIGELEDLVVQDRGESRRVTDLLIKGSGSTAVVKGFRIRTILGLRDTLFVIDREYDSEGNIKNFIFTGKGWGHGVGFCQVGSFGMARSGAKYREILKKYYEGIKVAKIY
jgi:stage II sporulation protein D